MNTKVWFSAAAALSTSALIINSEVLSGKKKSYTGNNSNTPRIPRIVATSAVDEPVVSQWIKSVSSSRPSKSSPHSTKKEIDEIIAEWKNKQAESGATAEEDEAEKVAEVEVSTSAEPAPCCEMADDTVITSSPAEKVGPAATLKQVIVVHRHGDRTPITENIGTVIRGEDDREFWASKLPSSTCMEEMCRRFGFDYASDKIYDNARTSSFRDQLRGKLTQRGVEDLTTLGGIFRQRYITELGFLDSKLHQNNSKDIFIRTTPLSRCLRSAFSILSGLYPPSESDDACTIEVVVGDGNPDLAWDRETMWPLNRMCKYQKEYKVAADKIIPGELLTRKEQLEKVLRPMLGVKAEERMSLTGVMEVLHCRYTHGYPLPENCDASLVGELKQYQWDLRRQRFNDKEALKLFTGRFLNEVLSHMTQKAEGDDETLPKWLQFSGHDSTMIPLLVALNIEESSWPSYGANVVIELWRQPSSSHVVNNEEDFYVQVFHNHELKYRCSFKEFKSTIAPFVYYSAEEYNQDCSRTYAPKT